MSLDRYGRDVHVVDLVLQRNEASDIAPVTSRAVLDAHGWDVAYFAFLDEGHLDDAVAVLGHPAGRPLGEGWEHHPVTVDCGEDAGKTDDAEASASYDGFMYVVASHYGKKAGPLQVTRQWLARFRQDDLAGRVDDYSVSMQVMRGRFRLHRIVNDALAACGIELIADDERMAAAFIAAGRAGGEKKGKKWARRIEDGDRAFNIEAAAFRADGSLLLGLRFPVSASGAPVLVELAGVPASFDGGEEPSVAAVWHLDGPGSEAAPVGFRALTTRDGHTFDCVLGNLDATDKGSLLIECYPQGGPALSSHWRFDLGDRDDGGQVGATHVHSELGDDEQRVEGIAPGPDGHMLYVVDEEGKVGMRFVEAVGTATCATGRAAGAPAPRARSAAVARTGRRRASARADRGSPSSARAAPGP